jgi:hypothetical protein
MSKILKLQRLSNLRLAIVRQLAKYCTNPHYAQLDAGVLRFVKIPLMNACLSPSIFRKCRGMNYFWGIVKLFRCPAHRSVARAKRSHQLV